MPLTSESPIVPKIEICSFYHAGERKGLRNIEGVGTDLNSS